MLPPSEILVLLVTGFAAGTLGGLLGIGGSVIMIPAMTLLLDRSQHLAQAVAMIVNVAVAFPSATRHHRAGAVRWDVFTRFLPAGIVTIVIGVEVSDLFEDDLERMLTRIFGAFLLYVIASNLMAIRRGDDDRPPPATVAWLPCLFVGAITGFMSGLLGIGGGIIAVPLLQRVAALPLRQCIATSSAVMVITAIVGAVRKNMTLPTHVDDAGLTLTIGESLLTAACLAPTAMIGGLLGARLTHALPLRWVRAAFLVLLCVAAFRMMTAA